jgi:hypothetical protein
LTGRAGVPVATTPGGIFPDTTAPAPMTEPAPTLAPGRNTLCAPRKQPSPIWIRPYR